MGVWANVYSLTGAAFLASLLWLLRLRARAAGEDRAGGGHERVPTSPGGPRTAASAVKATAVFPEPRGPLTRRLQRWVLAWAAAVPAFYAALLGMRGLAPPPLQQALFDAPGQGNAAQTNLYTASFACLALLLQALALGRWLTHPYPANAQCSTACQF